MAVNSSFSIPPKLFYLDLEVESVPKEKNEPSHCITQIVLHVDDKNLPKEDRTFEAFIDPPEHLRRKAKDKHFGHGNLRPQSYYLKDIWKDYLVPFVNEKLAKDQSAVILTYCGYKHDWPILQNELARFGAAIPKRWKCFDIAWLVGSLKLSEINNDVQIDRASKSATLSMLCHKLGTKVLPAHDAYNDVKMLKGVFKAITLDANMDAVGLAMLKPREEHPVKSVAEIINAHKTAVFLFYDFETTGLFPRKGENKPNPRVVSLAALIPEKNVAFETKVNPGIPIPAEATKIHHLKDADVANAPDIKTALLKLDQWTNEQLGATANRVKVLAGHNIWGYDEKVKKAECERVGLEYKRCKSIDTLALANHLFAGRRDVSRKLQRLRKGFGIPKDNAHTADGDVRINYQVFKKFIEGLDPKQVSAAVLSGHPVLSLGALIRDYGNFSAKAYVDPPFSEDEKNVPEPKLKKQKLDSHPKLSLNDPIENVKNQKKHCAILDEIEVADIDVDLTPSNEENYDEPKFHRLKKVEEREKLRTAIDSDFEFVFVQKQEEKIQSSVEPKPTPTPKPKFQHLIEKKESDPSKKITQHSIKTFFPTAEANKSAQPKKPVNLSGSFKQKPDNDIFNWPQKEKQALKKNFGFVAHSDSDE